MTDQDGSELIPVYKIPIEHLDQEGEGSAETPADPEFRTTRHVVEPRGLEPLTPTLPVWCATSCATAPCALPGLPGTGKLYTRQPAWSPRGVPAAAPAQLSATSAGK